VLLKFLDSVRNDNTPEAEEARNAFSAIYQLFRSCTFSVEHLRASKNLEVCGRAIGNGQAHLEDHVNTRMGASVMYNAVWAASRLRGREGDPEFSTEALFNSAKNSNEGVHTSQSGSQDTLSVPLRQRPESGTQNHQVAISTPSAHPTVEAAGLVPPMDTSLGAMDEPFDFPFGAWDNTLYDTIFDGDWMGMPMDWSNGFSSFISA
jgi:hypothetical protein